MVESAIFCRCELSGFAATDLAVTIAAAVDRPRNFVKGVIHWSIATSAQDFQPKENRVTVIPTQDSHNKRTWLL